MTIAIYSNKSFQVNSQNILTFNDFIVGSSLQVESQDCTGRKPSTYIKGADLDKLSFSIPLNISQGHNVMKEYQDWKDMLEAGNAYPFVLGNKPISNTKWIVISVQLSDVLLGSNGKAIKATLNVELQEFIRAGSVAASKSANKKKAKAKASKSKEKVDINKLILGPVKSESKRSNPSATTAVNAGAKTKE